jgi:hypothetical protein
MDFVSWFEKYLYKISLLYGLDVGEFWFCQVTH